MVSAFFAPNFPLTCGLLTSDARWLERHPKLANWPESTLVHWLEKMNGSDYGECASSTAPAAPTTLVSLCRLPNASNCFLVLVDNGKALTPSGRKPVSCALALAIAEQWRLQNTLDDCASQYRALFELAPVGVYVREHALIRQANPAMASLLRVPSAEEVADRMACDDLVVPEERSPTETPRLPGEAAYLAPHSFTALRQDGSRFSAQIQERPVSLNQRPAILGILTDISGQKQLEAELVRRAASDALTALPNRTLLFDRLQQLIARARREDSLFALLLLDIDEFGAINQRAGQSAGDQILRIAAERFASTLRSSDTLARIDGDEFAVIADNLLFGDDVIPVAQKLLEALTHPISLHGEQFCLSVSIGVALFPSGGDNADALCRTAENALHLAKQNQRGRFHIAGTGENTVRGENNAAACP